MPHPTKGIHDLIIDTDGVIWIPEWMGPGNHFDVFDTKTVQWVATYPMDPDHVFKTVVRSQAIHIDSKHNVYMNWNLGSAMSRSRLADQESHRDANAESAQLSVWSREGQQGQYLDQRVSRRQAGQNGRGYSRNHRVQTPTHTLR